MPRKKPAKPPAGKKKSPAKPAAPHPGKTHAAAREKRPGLPHPASAPVAPPAPAAPPAAITPPAKPAPRPAVIPPNVPGVLGVVKPIDSTGPGKASLGGPKSGVVIVGSLNMDLVARTEVMPAPGETVMGQDLLQNPGGKGGNQAVAAGRLWHRRSPGSKMLGRVGDDLFGQNVLAALQKAKVDTESVLTTRNAPTGTAMIVVDRHGENAIVVAGGANRQLAATDLLAQRKTIESSAVLVAQLEVPADTVACAFALAKRSGVLTILDPAPAPSEGLPESLYHVDVLTPNQIETQQMTGILVRSGEDARRAAERFLLRGTRIVIIKMGSQGAVIVHKNAAGTATIVQPVPGHRVPVVDTTGAGDAFTAALAVALAESVDLVNAVRFANAAGALAVTKHGAMGAMPTRAEVDALLAGV